MRNFVVTLGVTEIVPHLKLDPQNITQFRERRPVVVEVNRRLIQNAILTLQAKTEELQLKIDDSLIQITQKVDEDLVIATAELEETQGDVDAGLLAPTILAGLRSVIEDLKDKQTQPDYMRARELLEERRMREAQEVAAVEPGELPTGYTFNEDTKLYQIPLPSGEIITTKGEQKAKLLGRLAVKPSTYDELTTLLGIKVSVVGAWMSQLRADKNLKAKSCEVYYEPPVQKTRGAKGVYGLRKIEFQTPVTEVVPPPEAAGVESGFTKQEIAILQRLIQEKAESPIKINGDYILFEIPLHVVRAFEKLIEGFSQEDFERLAEEEKLELKSRTLNKVTELIKNGNANNLINNLPPDQQIVMRWIYILDHKGPRGMAIRFLSETPQRFTLSVRQWIKEVIASEGPTTPDTETGTGTDSEQTSTLERIEEQELSDEILEDPIPELYILALDAYIDNPNMNLSEIVDLLDGDLVGSSDCIDQARRILNITVKLLQEKMSRGFASEEERELWIKVQAKFPEEDLVKDFSERTLKSYLGSQEGEVQDENTKINTSEFETTLIPKKRAKIYDVEKRFPEMRANLRGIVEEVKSKNIPRQFTLFELRGLFFGNLRLDVINQANRNGVINLEHELRSSYHPSVPHLEAVLFIFHHRNRHNLKLNPRGLKEVREIAEQVLKEYEVEFDKEAEEKKNSNGH